MYHKQNKRKIIVPSITLECIQLHWKLESKPLCYYTRLTDCGFVKITEKSENGGVDTSAEVNLLLQGSS